MHKLAVTLSIMVLLSILAGMAIAQGYEGPLPSTGPASRISGPGGEDEPFVPPMNPGPQAYGLLPYSSLVHWDDLGIPSAWTVVGPVPQFHAAADFLGDDFDFVYALDRDTDELVTIDTATGARTVLATFPPLGYWTGMTGHVTGEWMYASSSVCGVQSYLYNIDPVVGTAQLVGPMREGSCMIDIAIDRYGKLWGVDLVDDSLYQISTGTGEAFLVGPTGVSADFDQSLDVDFATDTLYWAAFDDFTWQGELWTIDTSTGAATFVGVFPGGAQVDGLAIPTVPSVKVFATHVRIVPLPAQGLLLGLVRVATGNGATPVGGAAVYVDWTLPIGGGFIVPQIRPTYANGLAFPVMVSNWPGTYVLDLVNVTAAGYTYDPDLNWESSATYTRLGNE